jgi:hypothetical protein
MHNLAIVGGFAAGKTTLSEGLVQQGWTRVSFARLLKEMAARAYGEEIQKNKTYSMRDLGSGETRGITGRRVLQELGQSVKSMDRDFWISSLLSDIRSGVYGNGPYVTDDCRFPYEADALRLRGFVIVRLDVPLDTRIRRYYATYGNYPTPAELVHPSEIELVDIEVDHVINGEQDPKDILMEVYKIGMGG